MHRPASEAALVDQPELLLPEVIANNAKFRGNHLAAICGEQRLTWRDFDRRSNQVANALIARGIERDDKVGLLMRNSIAMFELSWGVIKAGAVVVPLNTMMSPDALARMVDNADAKLLFVDATTAHLLPGMQETLTLSAAAICAVETVPSVQDFAASIAVASEAAPNVPIGFSDTMIIIYSSGTTGTPKGIELSHWARHNYTLACGPELGIDRFAVSLCSTPLYTNGTWLMMLPTVFRGGTLVLLPKFSPRAFLETVERERCTHTFGVPTQFIAIVDGGEVPRHDISSMRAILSAGQPLLSDTYDRLCAAFPQAGVFELYGQTEGFLTMAGPRDFALGKQGSVGLPLFGADICIIDEQGKVLGAGELGEITGYGPGLMKGYYKGPARTAEIIWRDPRGRTYLRSGDIGRIDEDGYLFIAGRIRDMIKSGGINVFASDIEEVFIRHPDAGEVACIGIPDEKWGETPLLLVIPREGARISEIELMQWGNARLGKYQRVCRVEFRSSFPRAAHDKIQKRALRDPYWAAHERKV